MKKLNMEPRPETFESTGRFTIETKSCLGSYSSSASSPEGIKNWAENERISQAQWHKEEDGEHRKWGDPTIKDCKFNIGPVYHVLKGQATGELKWEPIQAA